MRKKERVRCKEKEEGIGKQRKERKKNLPNGVLGFETRLYNVLEIFEKKNWFYFPSHNSNQKSF